MPKQYDFTRVFAIHGTADFEQSRRPTQGYAVRDRFERNRHLGYVAKVGRTWQAVRPKRFDPYTGFHNARHHLHGDFGTRHEAAEYLRRLAIAADKSTTTV